LGGFYLTYFKLIKELFKIENLYGYELTDIEFAKRKLGNLPKVLVDYYYELGKIDKLNYTKDNLISIEDLHIIDYNFMPIYYENKSLSAWSIKSSEMYLENPPVYYSSDRENWKLEFLKLSDFLDSIAHKQAIFGLKYNTGDFYEITDEEFSLIKKNMKKKNLEIPQRWAIEFYGDYNDSVVAITEGFEGLYQMTYSSSSEDHFYKMNDFLFEI
jgi:hypothetical protein